MNEQIEQRQKKSPDLWDTQDIADFLGKSRKTVQNHDVNQPGFPKPLGGASRNRLYWKSQVLRYLSGEKVGRAA